MPNPMRGEAELGERKVVIDFDRFCSLELATGRKVPDLLADFDAGLGFADVRAWLRVFLEPVASDEEIAEIITAGGVEKGYRAALKALAEAMTGFMSKPKKEQEARPREAA